MLWYFPWVIKTNTTRSHSSLQMRSNHLVLPIRLQYLSALIQEQNRKGNENMVFWTQTHRKHRQYHFRGPSLVVRRRGCSKYTWCAVLGVSTNLTAQNCSYRGVLYHLVDRQSTPASKTIQGSYPRLNTFLCRVVFISYVASLIHVVKSLFPVQL